MKINILQQILSYFYPVRIHSAVGKTTTQLGLYRYQRRWQLSSATALYSDGSAYRPLKEAFALLKKDLPLAKKMLVLGAGLGSAISVLQKMRMPINSTLVDIDPQVISWGKAIIGDNMQYPCNWVCADVQQFIESHDTLYNLIVVDIFEDRTVPDFVTTQHFLNQCRRLLQDNDSNLVLNYIINNEEEWQNALENIEKTFKIEHTIRIGINRILILKNNA